MSYVLNTPADLRAMLDRIGVKSVADLFRDIPEAVRLKRPLEVPPALTEIELQQHVTALAKSCISPDDAVCFLGGGCYDHFIPAVVDAIAGRSEFYTAYTPYQAEASQGSLQAFFEYQTLISQLTGLDVANASLYDGSSAVAEAMVMAIKSGLDPATTLKVIRDGAGSSRMLEVRGPMMVKGDYSEATMKVQVWQKDMTVIGASTHCLRSNKPDMYRVN